MMEATLSWEKVLLLEGQPVLERRGNTTWEPPKKNKLAITQFFLSALKDPLVPWKQNKPFQVVVGLPAG